MSDFCLEEGVAVCATKHMAGELDLAKEGRLPMSVRVSITAALTDDEVRQAARAVRDGFVEMSKQ